MNRMCIYLTYDDQKVIDGYIGYMLKELKTCVDYIVVIVNETEVIRGRSILEEYADDIFYRKNIGFDAGGFKEALCYLIGWHKIMYYDELVLVNDSMFGPFKSMQSIFTEMDRKKADFWGLIKHGEQKNGNMGYIPEHIQSFFYVIRKKMLHCLEFKEYWNKLPYFNTFEEVIRQHEIKFTKYFADKGFTYAALADSTVNDSRNVDNNFCQYSRISYELIKKRNFPFLKKQQISLDVLGEATQENFRLAIDYVDIETDYDVNLIWNNIIRTLNITDLYRNLHLNYIISPGKNNTVPCSVKIIIFSSYDNSAEYIKEYLSKLSKNYVIKIYVKNQSQLEEYRDVGLEAEIAIPEKVIESLKEAGLYDFVCFLRDIDFESEARPKYEGKSYLYNIWENLIKDENHISGIINKFQEEPYLGFLTHPKPNFEKQFGGCGNKWNGNFKKISNIISQLRINCKLSEHLAPYRVTDCFWIRGCILDHLKSIRETDYKYLPYLWSYFAQDSGYYCGVVESVDYASMNEVNLQCYLDEIVAQNMQYFGNFQTFQEMKEQVGKGRLDEFCRRYSRILIYGAGYLGKRYRKLLTNVEAYIVSEGNLKSDDIEGVPVKYLSEIEKIENCGIVLCLNQKNQSQVIPVLEKYGVKNYISV